MVNPFVVLADTPGRVAAPAHLYTLAKFPHPLISTAGCGGGSGGDGGGDGGGGGGGGAGGGGDGGGGLSGFTQSTLNVLAARPLVLVA